MPAVATASSTGENAIRLPGPDCLFIENGDDTKLQALDRYRGIRRLTVNASKSHWGDKRRLSSLAPLAHLTELEELEVLTDRGELRDLLMSLPPLPRVERFRVAALDLGDPSMSPPDLWALLALPRLRELTISVLRGLSDGDVAPYGALSLAGGQDLQLEKLVVIATDLQWLGPLRGHRYLQHLELRDVRAPGYHLPPWAPGEPERVWIDADDLGTLANLRHLKLFDMTVQSLELLDGLEMLEELDLSLSQVRPAPGGTSEKERFENLNSREWTKNLESAEFFAPLVRLRPCRLTFALGNRHRRVEVAWIRKALATCPVKCGGRCGPVAERRQWASEMPPHWYAQDRGEFRPCEN